MGDHTELLLKGGLYAQLFKVQTAVLAWFKIFFFFGYTGLMALFFLCMFITANADYSFSVLLLEASVFLFFFL